ncbi:MAG: coproporphyrinogen III oxidase [Rhodospirillales bacterium]|nr:coproporphyrinogen III oxidase [Rhodospirillales bacterium]
MTGELAIYIHWPFCRSKCPYCDFNSTAAEDIDQARWREALVRDLTAFAEETKDRAIVSVFFGGGTPSLMDPITVSVLLAAVREQWRVSDDLEVTLEANPTSVEAGRFAELRAAGVNRISIGVQSFDDKVLAFLGRVHDADEAGRAVATAAKCFPRLSFDLIYAWPGQSATHWRRELRMALDMAGEHLSAYQLTIERGTAFHRKGVVAAEDDVAADLFEITQDVLAGASFGAYEVSNHARPGAACRHNLFIWRGGDYVGIGPGAHGRLTLAGRTLALQRHRQSERWLNAVEAQGHGSAIRDALTHDERIEEILLLGLRLADGVRRDTLRRLTGREIEDVINREQMRDLIEAGFAELDDIGLRVTDSGRLRLDAITNALLT